MPNPENLKGKGFKDNPQNINRNGRPRKSFSSINKELEAKGVKKLSKTDLIDAYGYLLNLTQNELKEIVKHKDTPFAMKIIILELNKASTRAKAMQDYRDYMFGKAMQQQDITSGGKPVSSGPTIINFVERSKDAE